MHFIGHFKTITRHKILVAKGCFKLGLYYQGINVNDIVDSLKDRKFGFEETVYLLMFGHLPNKTELEHFLDVMFELQELSGRFVRDVVMKASNENIMKFRDYLNDHGIVATIRRELGSDIDAACGQLRRKNLK